ncbi:ATP-dependent nuclease [Proteus hauseri]|uniref:ATP-dependent nuclease n=1 Tax=Proteus hauseri TaxID=183417 RepID=UPI0032DBA42A
MSVYITSLDINNYLSCKNTSLELSSFTPLVGYNNAGKSNILSAIKWLLEKRTLTIEEIFNNQECEVSVSAVIEGIDNNALALITSENRKKIIPYISEGMIKVRRIQRKISGAKASDIKFEVFDTNKNPSSWVSNPGGIEESIKNIFPEIIHIKAMTDAVEDSTKNKTSSTIGRLLSQIIESVQELHASEFNDSIRRLSDLLAYNGSERFQTINETDNGINSIIGSYFPDISVKIHFPTPSLEEIFKSGTLKVFEHGQDIRDMSMFGHGSQRTIQMALIQYLAKIKSESSTKKKPNILLLIDEPELYLHPTAVELLREALIVLSKNGYQVIITTHSGLMITSKQANVAVLVRKSQEKCTETRKTLKQAIAEKMKDTKEAHHFDKIFSLTNSSQILFSEKVIIVEGKTELKVIDPIYRVIKGNSLGANKIALLSIDGKTAIKRTKEILNCLDVPHRVITDLDYITSAVAHGYIKKECEDIIKIKAIFISMQNEKPDEIRIDKTTGFPSKIKNGNTAAYAFSCLAKHPDATIPIANIKEELKKDNIYIWSYGAIEDVFGFDEKNESEWFDFKSKLDDSENDEWKTIVENPDDIEGFINWI